MRKGGAFCATAALTAVVLFVQPTLADISRGQLFVGSQALAVLGGPTYVSGTISSNTTWTAAESPYVISSSVTVNSGVTLTIEPGVVVKMGKTSAYLSVNGTLVSAGTEAQPVVFTSIKDDAHGGDTNGDGSATSPAPGNWSNITLGSAASASSLQHTEVLYGGYYLSASVIVSGSSPSFDSLLVDRSHKFGVRVSSGEPSLTDSTISNCTIGVQVSSCGPAARVESCEFTSVSTTGIDVQGGSPELASNHFSGPCASAISVASAATPRLDNNTGSGYNHRILLGSTGRSASWTLTKQPFPYVASTSSISSGLTVNPGCTLAIEPGVVLKMLSTSSALSVGGTLVSNGTLEDPVVFTTIKDDTHGGDTNNDGSATSPTAGGWGGVVFESTASGNTLSHVEVLYAGYNYNGAVRIVGSSPVLGPMLISNSSSYGVRVDAGAPVITDSRITNCSTGVTVSSSSGCPRIEGCEFSAIARDGIRVWGGSPTIQENVFVGRCAGSAILVEGAATPVLSNNTGSGYNHRITLERRSASWTLTKQEFPYVCSPGVSIAGICPGVTLSVDPGVVVKMAGISARFVVDGTLHVNGTAEQPVVFTELQDDAHGGDTNNDGSASSPNPGHWSGITFESTAAGSSLAHAEVLYAGWSGHAGIQVDGSSPTIESVTVARSASSGVRIDSGAPTITNATITGNNGTGVYVSSGTGADPVINWSDIYNNGSHGTENLYAPVGSGIDARYNYWGRTSGPRAVEHTYAQCEPWLWYSFKTPKSAQVLGGRTWCGIWGEPVNTATGNFYYEASDLVLPGVGPSIAVGRTYNHQDAGSRTVLGYGWTLDADSFVQPQADGSALVVYPGGARKTFTPNGSGGYVAPAGTLDTLAATATGGWTLTSPDRTVNTYGSSGTLLVVADRYGNLVLYTRNTSGAITRIEGTGGRYAAFTYTGDLLTKVADNAGRQVTYAYSTAGDLHTVTDVTGAVTTYTSDSSHRVTAVASAEHPTEPFVSHTYDAENRVDVQHDGYGNTGTLSYVEGATTITNNRGYTQVHQFDSEYRLTAETDGAGDVSTRTYNAAGLLATVTDANDHTSSFTYDGNGNTTSATDGAGHATEAAYDPANNNLLWSEDAEDVRTTYAYDATGTYLERVTNPVYEILYGHYTNGLVSDVTLAGATTHFGYDAAGRLTSVTDSLGATSTVAYDTAGNVTGTTDAMGRSASFTYDAAGRVLTATDPADEIVSFAYDLNGNRTSATDQLGKVTLFSYDVLDKLSGVTDPLSNTWAYTYDENYNLATVTNPKDATTSYTYSADDLLIETEDALGHTWAFTHDAVGNTLESEYPTGETVTRTYTADDLLATSTYSTGETYAFSYTPTHRLASVSGSNAAESFAYNPVGWLLSTHDGFGTSLGGFDTTFTYDAAGRVTSLDSDAAPVVAYAYDLAGRLTSLEASGAVATFTSDATGARTGASLPNGALTSYSYDPAGRIESIVTTAASGVIAESYTRDAAGRVAQDSSGAYAYDDAGRLTTWTAPDDTVTTYTYDDAYNLTGASVDGSATASFAYDAADRITSPGFTYDDAGNLTSDGERLFTYDAAGRLVAVADASTETTIATYTYDAFNRRTSSGLGDLNRTYYHYDGASARVIAEQTFGVPTTTFTYDDAGQLFSMTRAGETYYYHTNARGDVVALSDSTGAVVNTYTYDPWGRPLSASETVANPYRYASYRFDSATGLYYCWNRYYAPELARFLTRDIYPGELSDPVTMNPYLYCGGDPVNRVDPSGMYNEEVLAYSIEGGLQYAMDTTVLLWTGCAAALLIVGVGTGNPGLVYGSKALGLLTAGLDAYADSVWDANTGGCRSQANAERAVWESGKYSGGMPDPLTSAMSDTFRIGYSLPAAYARLQADADYYFDFDHLKERIAQ